MKFDSYLLSHVAGLLIPDQAEWLYNTANAIPKDGQILEIGTFCGHSTAAMAMACQGTKRFIRTITIDPLHAKLAWSNLSHLGLVSRVTVITGDSAVSLARMVEDRLKFDFAFIDGDHHYDAVFRDFQGCLKLVKPGGTIALHDVDSGWPEVQRVWNEHASKRLSDHRFCHSIAAGVVRATP